MRAKPYKFKVGDRIKTRKNQTGYIIGRFHPDDNVEYNSYAVRMECSLPSPYHDGLVNGACFSEDYLKPYDWKPI